MDPNTDPPEPNAGPFPPEPKAEVPLPDPNTEPVVDPNALPVDGCGWANGFVVVDGVEETAAAL